MNSKNRGIRVTQVERHSCSWEAGMRVGDTIRKVDGRYIDHELDFVYLSATDAFEMDIVRRGRERSVRVVRKNQDRLGLHFARKPLRRCANRCVFCFIDQLPPRLRGSLYIKDEDYRHSFVNGNYITLCGMSREDLENIVCFRFSPIYISVHATDAAVRRRLLRNRHAGDVLNQMRFLARNGIHFHAQIVLCPGVNDGDVLRRTVAELRRFTRALLSLAIVPVGLTRFHTEGLRGVSREEARAVITDIECWSERDKALVGTRRIFAADELYVCAGRSVPKRSYYEDYPQIENGVGLIRQLLDESVKLKRHARHALRHESMNRRTILVLTSVDAEQVLRRVMKKLDRLATEVEFSIRAVRNDFFGHSVTVAGLLTGRDLMRAVRHAPGKPDCVVVPSVVLNYRGVTLDGYSVQRMSRLLGVRVIPVDGLVDLLRKLDSGDCG